MNTNKDITMNDCNNTKKILSIDELKYIAIIAMLIDHVGNAFINDSSQLYHIIQDFLSGLLALFVFLL